MPMIPNWRQSSMREVLHVHVRDGRTDGEQHRNQRRDMRGDAGKHVVGEKIDHEQQQDCLDRRKAAHMVRHNFGKPLNESDLTEPAGQRHQRRKPSERVPGRGVFCNVVPGHNVGQRASGKSRSVQPWWRLLLRREKSTCARAITTSTASVISFAVMPPILTSSSPPSRRPRRLP